MKIYVASSWRNAQHSEVVRVLREAGHDVFDFKNPPGGEGFTSWPGVETKKASWTKEEARTALEHPRSKEALKSDWDGMRWADAVVCVQPFGKSASVELGWAVGAGKPTALLLADGEPELMQSMADVVFTRLEEVVSWLDSMDPARPEYSRSRPTISAVRARMLIDNSGQTTMFVEPLDIYGNDGVLLAVVEDEISDDAEMETEFGVARLLGSSLDLALTVISLERERDAYKRAKQENDDRFMRERDEARAERDALLRSKRWSAALKNADAGTSACFDAAVLEQTMERGEKLHAYGKRLRALRTDAEVTMGDLADYLGVTVPFLSDVERGREPPFDEETTRKICARIGIEADELLAAAEAAEAVLRG